MNKWEESTIAEIGQVVSGGTPSTSVDEFWNGGEILFVTPFDLSRNNSKFIVNTARKISEKGLKNSSANLLPKGSIVISSRAPIGYVAIGGNDFTTNQGCKSIIPTEKFDSEFLYYNLNFYVERIKRLGEGTTFAEISKGDLEKIKLPHPTSIETQQKIAKVLSSVDAVIEKTEAAIAKYKAIKQGMLHDLFTRGIDTNTGKLRPEYKDAPQLYKKSELGWIPKEWEVKTLENCTTKIGDGIHATPKYSENTNYYFINGNNLSDGEILIGSSQCVSKVEYEKHYIELNNQTILYSINGTIGNIAVFRNQKVILGKSVCYMNCKPNIDLGYIYFLLQTYPISKFYELEMTGSTIRNLSLTSIRKTPILFPKTKDERELIAERIKNIELKLQTEKLYLQKMQAIKKGLMADLLSGKKEVKINSNQ